MEGGREITGLAAAGVLNPDAIGVTGNLSVVGLAKMKYRDSPSALVASLLPKLWNVQKSSGAKRDQMMSLRRRRSEAARPIKPPSAPLMADVIEDVSDVNSSDDTFVPRTSRCRSRAEISGVRNDCRRDVN